jgi:AraC family transcriptional regulator
MNGPRNKNRLEYQKRVNRVMDHVQAHRAEDLSLESLAAVAAFSPYHFHRIFRAMTGETVSEFVQRIRLESAASALVLRPQNDILSIALDNGFQSASAFARAFKDRFRMTASQWRAGGHCGWRKPGQADSKLGQADGNACKDPLLPEAQDDSRSSLSTEEDIMNPNISVESLPSYRIAYLRNVGPYGAGGGIPDLWQRLLRWGTAHDLWTADRLCLGIAYDDPSVTEPAKCRYDAAIVVPDGFAADGQVNLATTPAGKYARIHFAGTVHEIAKPWHDLYGWLPGSGFQPEDRPGFEVYRGEAVDWKTGIFTCDIYMAIKPL